MLELPKDPTLLLSTVNMHLRDTYRSLDELCEDLNVEKEEIVKKLSEIGYEYNEQQNKFW